MSEEIWLPIKGYEGRYEASSHGRFRSVERLVRSMRHGKVGTRLVKSRIIKQQVWAPYFGISLLGEDGIRGRKNSHRIIAETFIPNPENLPVVNHIDADGYNNKVDNLEWCTIQHNCTHTYKIGNRPVGKAHHFARLDRDTSGRCLPAKDE